MRLFSSDTCMITELAQLYERKGSRDFSKDLVILPTGRLATKFLAHLASSLRAFHPPQIHTLESFIHKNSPETKITIGDQTCDLIFKIILKKNPQLKYLRLGHERELRLLYNEMIDSGIASTAFEAAHEELKNNIFHSDLHLSSVATKIEEIRFVYHEIHKLFQEQNIQTKSERMAAAALRVGQAVDELSSYDSCYVVGLTSLADSWMPAVKMLARSEQCEIWLTEKPRLLQKAAPISRLIDELLPQLQVITSKNQGAFKAYPRVLMNAETPFHEVISAYQIAQWYMEKGVSPSSIGILQSSEGIYGPIISSLSTSLLNQANLAMTTPLVHTIFGSWLKALINIYADDFSLKAVFDWFKNPITHTWLTQTFEMDLDLLIWNTVQKRHLNIHQVLRSESIGNDFQEQMENIFSILDEEASSISAWLERLDKLLAIFPYTDHVESSFQEPLKALMEEFRQSVILIEGCDHSPLGQKEFFQILEEQCLNQGLRRTGEPLAGIQVLNLSESRYYPFQVVIILGCNEGVFPKALPKDELLDNFFKKQMGFLGWEQLEAMEDQTFYLLHARVPHLIMTRCLEKSNENTVKSRFIESLVLQEDLIEVDSSYQLEKIWDQSDHFETDPECHDKAEGLWAPKDDIWRSMSASALKKLIACPYAFLLDRCRVRPFEFQDPSDSRYEGEWLHKVLQTLFSQTPPTSDPMSFKTWVKNELERLTVKFGPEHITEKPIYYQLHLKAWPAFAEHLGLLFGKDLHLFSKGLKETTLEDAIKKSPKIIVRQLERHLQGTIDSVDFSQGMKVLSDYKRKSIPQRTESILGLNPQLAFYVLALKQGGESFSYDKMLLGYWSILKGEWLTHGVGEGAREKSQALGLANTRTPEISALVQKVVENWEWREQSIMEHQRFYADPSKCELCDYDSICRKNAPNMTDQIQSQKFLDSYIKGSSPC